MTVSAYSDSTTHCQEGLLGQSSVPLLTCVHPYKELINNREHTNLDKPTRVGDHCRATGHSVSMKNTKILTRESNWHKRKVKEAIFIKQRAPTMNRDQGYHLPAIYNQIIPPKYEATHVTPVREQGP